MHYRNLDDLSIAFGGDPSLGAAAAVGRTAVANWRKRGAVPPANWVRIVQSAADRGIPGVTLEVLASLKAAPSQNVKAPQPTGTPHPCHAPESRAQEVAA